VGRTLKEGRSHTGGLEHPPDLWGWGKIPGWLTRAKRKLCVATKLSRVSGQRSPRSSFRFGLSFEFSTDLSSWCYVSKFASSRRPAEDLHGWSARVVEIISVSSQVESEALSSLRCSLLASNIFCFECRDASVSQDSCEVDDRLTRRSTRRHRLLAQLEFTPIAKPTLTQFGTKAFGLMKDFAVLPGGDKKSRAIWTATRPFGLRSSMCNWLVKGKLVGGCDWACTTMRVACAIGLAKDNCFAMAT
jgi:hypothetical protein